MKNLFEILLFTVCLSSTAFAKIYEHTYNNQLSLIEDANESVDIKVDLIRKSKHHVHIITYFWDDSEIPKRLATELNLANERGVEVRIVTRADFYTKIVVNYTKELDFRHMMKNILASSPFIKMVIRPVF